MGEGGKENNQKGVGRRKLRIAAVAARNNPRLDSIPRTYLCLVLSHQRDHSRSTDLLSPLGSGLPSPNAALTVGAGGAQVFHDYESWMESPFLSRSSFEGSGLALACCSSPLSDPSVDGIFPRWEPKIAGWTGPLAQSLFFEAKCRRRFASHGVHICSVPSTRRNSVAD